ncbi:MAG: CHASE domain-containing protein [Actinobacteria bacterium]|nr:CHASE domain-containing protein [Actinomycetota bacterium]
MGFVAAGIIATTLLASLFDSLASDDLRIHRADQLEAQTDQSIQIIEQRLLSAEHQIRGLEGLFAAGEVDRMAFRRYVDKVDDVEGLLALEFTRMVATSERESFEHTVQADNSLVEIGYPDFVVTPDTTHDDMFVVDYVEPMEGNEAAFGFDIGTNDSRRLAVERARDSAEMVASEGINLVQDDEPRSGFLLMRPVYEGDILPTTVEQRRTSFLGIVNGVFLVDELVTDINGVGSTIAIAIRDLGHVEESAAEGDLLYTTVTLDRQTTSSEADPLVIEREVIVGDRIWAVEITELTAITSPFGTPINVIVAVGILLTVASAVTAYTIMNSRERAAAAAYSATTDLREQAEDLRVARDKALDADSLKTAFLANMSHELRTPLNAVIGLSSVLTNQVFGALSEKQLDYLERISASGDHLLNVIEDLLDMARIEAGRDELHLEPLDLVNEINTSLDMIRNDVEQSGITLEGPRGDGAIISADRRRFRQILLNLMSNAAKFTAEGGKIGVDLTHEGEEARIEIWDTGIGIDDEEISKIFEPFHQVSSGNNTRPRPGSGLGLALSKRLVEMHNASIHVESSKEGSRFILRWPLSERETVTHKSRRRKTGARGSDLAGMRVLLAEDNEANRILTRDLLQVAGCNVTEATDGQTALDMARAEPPDVIVLDIQLPVVDGIEVARAIRSDDRLSDIPILAVTALAMHEDVDRIMAAGCDGYLAKPFTQDEFYAAMASLVRERLKPGHRAGDENRTRVFSLGS